LESLAQGVRHAVADHARLAPHLHRDIQAWGWQNRAAEFFQFFRAVAAAPSPVSQQAAEALNEGRA